MHAADNDQTADAERDAGQDARIATVRTRRAAGELGYLNRLFAGDKSLVVRALYRGSLPFVRGLMRKGNGVTGPDAVAAARARTREALDFVARETADGGYLVGVPTISKPAPMPASLEAWHAEWPNIPASPGCAQFARHRPASAAIS